MPPIPNAGPPPAPSVRPPAAPPAAPRRARTRLGVLATHPIQYHAPLHRALARALDVEVMYAHRQTAAGQAAAGFGVAFEWDVPLTDGFRHVFLRNRARRPSTDTFAGCDTPEVAARIRAGRYDAVLVHGWYTKSHLQAIAACWRAGVPVLVRGDSHLGTPRPGVVRLAKEVVYRAFIPRFDGYLVVGTHAEAYLRHYGADPARMTRVPHLVDTPFFAEGAARADRAALRAAAGAAPGSVLLLYVGKLLPGKRPGDLLAGAARLRAAGTDAHVAFVGTGPLEADLRAAAEAAGVPAHFAGFQNQTALPGWYAAADALVLPSESETWGLVVNEALACGTPAVVSDAVGCAPDLVHDRDPGRTGAVFAVGDPSALAAAVERLRPHVGTPALAAAVRAVSDAHAPAAAAAAALGAVESLTAARRAAR